jgi:hypothetical protein
MSALSMREQKEIQRANQSGREAVVFVHGLWLRHRGGAPVRARGSGSRERAEALTEAA